MITLIAAHDKNRVIGTEGKIPWYYKEDMQFFRKTTSNYTVLMGRKTYESIGKPLKNRRNIILSSQDLQIDGCLVLHDLKQAIYPFYQTKEELFIIGGESLYRSCMDYADKILITEVPEHHIGDAFFPEINLEKFRLIRNKETNKLTFKTYVRQ